MACFKKTPRLAPGQGVCRLCLNDHCVYSRLLAVILPLWSMETRLLLSANELSVQQMITVRLQFARLGVDCGLVKLRNIKLSLLIRLQRKGEQRFVMGLRRFQTLRWCSESQEYSHSQVVQGRVTGERLTTCLCSLCPCWLLYLHSAQ